jgi:hypothetical protein
MQVRRWRVFRRTVGFYATRIVEARTAEAARLLALENVRGEPTLTLTALHPPRLAVEEIEEIDAGHSRPQRGFVFYSGKPPDKARAD